MLKHLKALREFQKNYEGKEVKFTVTRQTPNGEMKAEYSATVEGDTMKGKVESPRGARDWTATKVK